MESHDDPGYDAHPERHAEYLQPEFEDHAIDRTARRKGQGFEDSEPGRQADREGWKDDVERDREGELNSRQKKRRHIHCNYPALTASQQTGWPCLLKSMG